MPEGYNLDCSKQECLVSLD